MIAHRGVVKCITVVPICVAVSLWLTPMANASPTTSLKFAGQFGREVNATEAGKGIEAEDICLAASGDACRPGKESAVEGGFKYPFSTAVDKATGDVYVADENDNRIEKLGPNGEFLLTWGQGVNENGKNVCKAGEKCQSGIAGSSAGQIHEPQSIAVDSTCFEEKLTEPTCKEADPANGNVYVLEGPNHRVSEFSPEGQFILMFGGKVNKTTGANICSQSEIEAKSVECQAGTTGSANGSFQIWAQFQGNLLTVGGPAHLIYVADEGRVQEFEHTGVYKTQVSLTGTTPMFQSNSKVTGLAVDGTGNLYVTESYSLAVNESDQSPKGIYEFAPNNPVAIKEIDKTDSNVDGIALDEAGHLAITNDTEGGTLFDLASGQPLGSFHPLGGMATGFAEATGLSFNGQGALYLADPGRQDVEMYAPVFGAELKTEPLASQQSCVEGTTTAGALATINCTLHGTVDPLGVTETEVWFSWGTTNELGNETRPKRKIPNTKTKEGEEETPVSFSAPVTGLLPNEPIYYDSVAEDHNFLFPEVLTSLQASFTTPTVPPRIVGQPEVSSIKATSAVFTGEVNPEHASSEYFAEYGPGEALAHCLGGVRVETCAGVNSTTALESERYRTIAATLEATGLQPNTTYQFRLTAINAKAQTAVNESGGPALPEGHFTTAPPVAPQAITGQFSGVTATRAIVSGQVNPDGEAASYAFELGVYDGTNTQYGIVAAGSAGEGTTLVAKELQLSGLHPDTTYAYRIKIESPFVQDETHTLYGAPATFTTEGSPTVLPIPKKIEMLPVPKVPFPKLTPPTKPLTREQKLKKALRVCERKRSKKQRTSCQRDVRKRYGSKPKKKR